MTSLEIEIDDELLEAFEQFAREEGRTVDELIEEAMRIYLETEKQRVANNT